MSNSLESLGKVFMELADVTVRLSLYTGLVGMHLTAGNVHEASVAANERLRLLEEVAMLNGRATRQFAQLSADPGLN